VSLNPLKSIKRVVLQKITEGKKNRCKSGPVHNNQNQPQIKIDNTK